MTRVEEVEFAAAIDEAEERGFNRAIEDRANLLAFICKKYNIPLLDMNCTVDEWEYEWEQQKEAK